MRIALAALALTACGNASRPAPPYDLSLHAECGALQSANGVAISTVHLRLVGVTAVSDRASADGRAQVAEIDLSPGGAVDQDLPSAPPGLYSAVQLALGDAANAGVDVQAVWNGEPLHATVFGGPFDVACPTAAPLQLGRRAHLALHADPAAWFGGVDLASATTDSDDVGLLLSNDDNAPQAQQLLINVVASLKLDCSAD
ncbi:MAG TPA: hypothetical protein VFF06_29740 [Polyangia bacterium]|nr:hypothetical protein [Polyangia bacterium]